MMQSQLRPELTPTKTEGQLRVAAVGVFPRIEAAEAAARDLTSLGFAAKDVSLVYRGPGSAPHLGAEDTNAQQGIVTGGVTGALLGGAIGLAVLAIPGIGALLVAGPLLAALTGALAGGSLGSLIGSLAGLGVPTEHAERYVHAVREGGVVLAVVSPDQATADRASRALTEHGASDVATFLPSM